MRKNGEFGDSSRGTSNSSSWQGSQCSQRAPVLNWQRGCYQKYSGGSCNVPDCPYLHDLSTTEIGMFLDWKKKQQQHLIFNSNSSIPSNSQSRSSSATSQDAIMELIKDAKGLPSMGPERQQMLRRLRKHFKPIRDEPLAELLPKDELGRSTSIGSLLHSVDSCKPCRNIVSSTMCSDGLRCCFCHLPHNFIPAEMVSSATAEHSIGETKRPGLRPTREQRENYRRLVTKIEHDIQKDPFGWDLDSLDLPDDLFDGRPDLKNKFFRRMADKVDRAKTERVKVGMSPSSSSAAAMSTPSVAVGSQSRPSSAQQTDAPLPVRRKRLVRL